MKRDLSKLKNHQKIKTTFISKAKSSILDCRIKDAFFSLMVFRNSANDQNAYVGNYQEKWFSNMNFVISQSERL